MPFLVADKGEPGNPLSIIIQNLVSAYPFSLLQPWKSSSSTAIRNWPNCSRLVNLEVMYCQFTTQLDPIIAIKFTDKLI